VIGGPDRVRGEVPVAYVVLKSAVDCAVLAERCRAKLASFKVPREVVVAERPPRNAMGKVQKHLLAARVV
jgi:acyl-coenzyme A synthetase/AMP-(fatty) acid ligase